MPVYLLHGFRWPRPLIRIHIILQNLDDAAAEWLVATGTTRTMLKNFHQLYPQCMEQLTKLRFVEQYDPSDLSPNAASQPYAYVADIVEEVKLGVDVDEVRGRGVGNDQWAAMMELRDKLAPEEKVGWYVVVCGDEERWAPPTMTVLRESGHNGVHRESESDATRDGSKKNYERKENQDSAPRGLKKLFSSAKLGRRKSRSGTDSVDSSRSPNSPASPPPVPKTTEPGGTANADSTGTISDRHTTTSPASELSASPPTNATAESVTGSISPIREQSATPNTEVSISPLRQDSTSTPRGISPADIRRALGPLDKIRRNSSPASRSGNMSMSTPHLPSQLQTPEVKQPSLPQAQPMPRFLKRLSLQSPKFESIIANPPTAPPIPQKSAAEETYEEVITLSPARTASIQSYRRSRTSILMQSGASTSQIHLSSVSESSNPAVYQPTKGDGSYRLDANEFRTNEKPQTYFGQHVTSFDLIANNIENAFVALR